MRERASVCRRRRQRHRETETEGQTENDKHEANRQAETRIEF